MFNERLATLIEPHELESSGKNNYVGSVDQKGDEGKLKAPFKNSVVYLYKDVRKILSFFRQYKLFRLVVERQMVGVCVTSVTLVRQSLGYGFGT